MTRLPIYLCASLRIPNTDIKNEFLSTLIPPFAPYIGYLLIPSKTIKSYLSTRYLRDSMKKLSSPILPYLRQRSRSTRSKLSSLILPYLRHCSRSKTSLLFQIQLIHPLCSIIVYNITYNSLIFYYNTLYILLLFSTYFT